MNKLNHIGIIVDGNGRWALERNKSRSEGHLEGSKTLEKLILYINNRKIPYLSLYVFSTENFKRSKEEVDYLMNLFMKWFKKCKDLYKKENIRILFSGRKENLSEEVLNAMKELEENTKYNAGLTVNFCLNYGSHAEIVDATKKICVDVLNQKIDLNDIDETLFSKYLYNKLPDIDLLIRTSGEQRLSNFMLWQLSYAELCFVDTYFPDFTEEEFEKVIDEYNNRDRRFGNIKSENK